MSSYDHRYPPVVVQHAIWLYLRFTLSYRDVEDLRGLDIESPDAAGNLYSCMK